MFSSNTSQTSGGYEIQRSLRFNSADSAYLDRTPASSGNRRTWTWSGWVKKSVVGDGRYPALFGAVNSTRDVLRFNGEALNVFFNNTTSANLVTTAVYRDVSAWYHVVLAVDTTQATDTNRIKLYVNGVQVTAFGTASYPAQNYDTFVNMNVVQRIGNDSNLSDGYYNGYMTEVNFIDGQALTPSSFGAFDAQTGVWGPTPYAGSYGTNGFYLNFSDNSNTTAATLGKDYSGNGNNWTPNNFSVSAGAGNDSLVDVPTNWGTDTGVGGTVRGNYCTLNPLNLGTSATISNGNLNYLATGSVYSTAKTTFGVSSGKWYAEGTLNSGGYHFIGISSSSAALSNYLGNTADSYSYFAVTGNKWNNGSNSAYGATYTAGDIIGVALDMDAGTLTFYKNGTSQGTAFTGLTGTMFIGVTGDGSGGGSWTLNFGQRPFAYTAPSGFKALNTQNLPTPTIGATTATQAGKFFNTVTYTGTQTTQSVTGVGFQPDLVWNKDRSAAWTHVLTDSVRGAGKSLFSQSTEIEVTNDGNGNISAFNSDGFTLAGGLRVNASGDAIVAWNWKANGAGVSNTDGSITSTVSANTTSGFSVVTYTGNATSGATVGHGLGVAPSMMIIKSRSASGGWAVYHRSLGATRFIELNSTGAAGTSTIPWNDTEPASTRFTIGSWTGTNASGVTLVAYCFAEISGFSKAFSYTGNGSTDGPFVFCGFRPAYVMIKRTDAVSSWEIHDTKRAPYNADDKALYANLSDAEATYVVLDELSNGFKLRTTLNGTNQSGGTYIGIAFAESPFKYALAR